MVVAFTPSKVAVIGAGGVGGFYGARLAEGGHDVKFLLREPAYTRACSNGLRVQSVDGDVVIAGGGDRFHASTSSIGEVDYCIVAVKGTADTLKALPPLVAPVIGPRTRVIAIMNGFVDAEICRIVPRDTPVFGAMAFTCCSKLAADDDAAPYTIGHSAYGSLTIGLAQEGRVDGCARAELERGAMELFSATDVTVKLEPDLRRGRWEKSLWNLPFNGLCVAQGGITVDKVVFDVALRAEAVAIMRETAMLGNEDLRRRENGPAEFAELGDELMAKLFHLTDTMGPYSPSTMLDLVAGAELETPFLFDYPLLRARELGVSVPHLERLVDEIHRVAAARGGLASVSSAPATLACR